MGHVGSGYSHLVRDHHGAESHAHTHTYCRTGNTDSPRTLPRNLPAGAGGSVKVPPASGGGEKSFCLGGPAGCCATIEPSAVTSSFLAGFSRTLRTYVPGSGIEVQRECGTGLS